MNKLTIGALTAIVIGIVAAVTVANQTAEAPTTDATTSTTEEAATNDTASSETQAELSGSGTFADFFGAGRSVRCTFSTDVDGVASEGEFWYSDERMRVESVTRAEGEVYTSNMINDGERTYIWGGTAAGMQAMVFNNETSNMGDVDTYESGQADARVSMDQRMQYDCDPWTAQGTRFVPPSDIEFVDMEAMMQGMFEGQMRGVPEGMNF